MTRGNPSTRLLHCAWGLGFALVWSAGPAAAQQIFGPGEERPEIEELDPAEPPQPLELPPLPAPTTQGPLSGGLSVFVREFVFEGHTVFSEAELAAVTAPYTGRAITSEELLDAAATVTALYIERGYPSSGARVPDQTVEDGVVHLQIIEGRLAQVEVSGVRWFRPRYFRDRLLRAGRAPVHVPTLERELRLLQRNRYVERIQAELVPDDRLGEGVLRLEVEERRPYDLVAELTNEHSPAIGAIGGRFTPSFANLLGHADELRARFDVTEGLFEWDLRYELPLNSLETRLFLRAHRAEAEVVERPFSELGIESRSTSWGIGLSHPLLRGERNELWLRIGGERRRLRSCIQILPPHCDAFSFLPGQPDPVQVASVLRLVQDWTRSTATDVIAARSTFSVGLDVWDATTSGTADGEFFAWLGQIQWAHRFSEKLLGSELVARADLQLANDPLLTLEKFAIGGQRSVRGYRENELVRDNGVLGSLELRIPLLRTELGRSLVQLVPFADAGHGWDERADLPDRTLASLGVGLRLLPWRWLRAELFWGGRLRAVASPAERDLQDEGLHFRVTLRALDALPWVPR